MRKLYASVTGTTGIQSIDVSASHGAQNAIAVVEASNTSLDIGRSISIDMGYTDSHGQVFYGYVKNLELKEQSKLYTLTCSDALVRAQDYFIASDNPNAPFSRQNISAENLVRDVLGLAGITSYHADASHFTFALYTPVEVNLTSAYDYSKFIADIIAFSLYADNNGTINFVDRKPYPDGDSSSGTLDEDSMIVVAYSTSDKDLRNRVVVYGAGGLHATASASSPYLPAGFYKTAVVAAPTVFDTQSMAQQAANYNLNLYNRLDYILDITTLGDYNLQPRKCYTVTSPRLDISGELWYLYSVQHTLNKSGYTCTLQLRK